MWERSYTCSSCGVGSFPQAAPLLRSELFHFRQGITGAKAGHLPSTSTFGNPPILGLPKAEWRAVVRPNSLFETTFAEAQ